MHCLLLRLQVWYCTRKGYKPWLEPDAKNTRTNEQGGHTTWCALSLHLLTCPAAQFTSKFAFVSWPTDTVLSGCPAAGMSVHAVCRLSHTVCCRTLIFCLCTSLSPTRYDEPGLLKAVEERLGRPVARLAPDLSLPPDMAARMAGSGGKYGQARGGGTSKEVRPRVCLCACLRT